MTFFGYLVSMMMANVIFGVCFFGIVLSIARRDIETFLVADAELLFLVGFGVLWQLWTAGQCLKSPWAASSEVLGAVATRMFVLGGGSYCLAVLYRASRKRDGLGFGDIKLMAAAGAWLPVLEALKSVGLAAFSALVLLLFTSGVQRRAWEPSKAIPFAAFLAPSFWLIWIYSL